MNGLKNNKTRANKLKKHKGGKTKMSRKQRRIKRLKKEELSKNPLYCSPSAKKNRVVSGSCFTKDAIEKITHAYNHKNPSNAIQKHLTPKQKWQTLRQSMKRISNCDQDKCWIESIPLDNREKNMLKAQLFVPPSPSEWKQNPNTWLTNFDIEKVLNQYESSHPEFHFMGPSPIDYDTRPNNNTDCVCNKLCNFSLQEELAKGKKKIGIVFNLDRHTGGGSHWVAMFIDLEDDFVFYFNSTGERIQKQIHKFKENIVNQGKTLLNKNIKYHVNTLEHQRSNTECGMYCLYFIITCLLREIDILRETNTGGGGELYKMSVEELVEYFTKGRVSDDLVATYRKRLFQGGTKVPP